MAVARTVSTWSWSFVLVPLLLSIANAQAPSAPLRPTIIFGDSLIDPGNNNYITTIARANWSPNGVDFINGQATGRFCNGRTVADIIAGLVGIPYIPPYLAPSTQGPVILQGINYASAAGGILDGTGANYIGRLGMNQQLQYFQNTISQWQSLLGPAGAAQAIANAVYYITLGSNDYINNYLLADSPTRPQYTPQQYQDYLISEFSKQLTLLYNLGARKLVVFNVGPLGCIPSQLVQQKSPDGSCIGFVNQYVQGFNAALGQLLNTLSASLPGSIFLYGNAYDLVMDKVMNPGNWGLTEVNMGCCGSGQYNGALPCLPANPYCSNRSQYLFWDAFHPTEAVNIQLGQAFYSGPTSAISPMNIQQLFAM